MATDQADPARVQTREDLAVELTRLRSESGLTVRDLAKRIDAPVATIGDYFAGRHLPGTRQLPLYRALLEACGVGDGWADAWVDALVRARRSSDGRAARRVAPYRGLEPFQESDADLFFGRRAALDELLGRLRELGRDPGSAGGLAVVVGPSGSGKSSLLMAGLLPAVNGGTLDTPSRSWRAVAARPEQLGDLDSPAALPAALPAAAPDSPTPVVVVDAFEEVLSGPAERRSAVVEQLHRLSRWALVVVALRADFYQAAAEEDILLGALRRSQVLLGPMSPDELREAVTGPAAQVGAVLEDGLVDLILADLAPGARPGFAHDPGALPLLSYALLAAWERAGRNQLTIADYRAVGGLRGAVLQAAEAAYQGLPHDDQELAKSLFARLVRIEGDGPPTRRRPSRTDLLDTGDTERDERAAEVLERFVAARLVTADSEAVQISHEALLSAWPRLAEWVEADREWLHLHQQLSDASGVWDTTGRDDSLLWRGARLDGAAEQAGRPGRELNRLEAMFLARSLEASDEQRHAERRRARRSQQGVVVVAVLAAVACVLAGVAIGARSDAVKARDEALSRQVAIESSQLTTSDPALAAQLAVAAYRIAPTVQARSTLINTTAAEVPARLLGPPGPQFVAMSGSGRLLAVAQSGNDSVALYTLGAGPARLRAQLQAGPPSAQDYAVAVSPDGRLLAVGGTTGTVGVFDVTDPARPRRTATLTGFASTVYSLAFSPDGRLLAGGGADGSLREWTVSNPRHPTTGEVLHTPGNPPVKAVAFLAHGAGLVSAGAGGTVAVWPPGQLTPRLAPGGGSTTFQTLSVSADGRWLAAGATDQSVHLWNIGPAGRLESAHAPLTGATSEIDSTAFNPAGTLLAVGAADGSLRLFDTTTWTSTVTLSQPNPVTGLAFDPKGSTVVSADSGGVTRLWPLPAPASLTEPGQVFYLGYSNRGRRLYVVSDGPAGDVTAWNSADPLHPTRIDEIELPKALGPVAGAGAVNPAGTLVAAANSAAQVQLIKVADPRHPQMLGTTLGQGRPFIEQLSFSPNGKLLAAGDDSGQLLLWDVTHPTRVRLDAIRRDTKGEVLGFAFSPDGRLLADAATDDKVRIYDVADPARPTLLATLSGFSDYAYDTAFTPDGRTLIAGSADGTVRLWDISNPSRPRLLGRPLSGPSGYVFSLSVSPDGRTLAAASTNHAVWLWNIGQPAHPKLLATLAAAKDSVFAVRFAPGNTTLAASGSDDMLHLWAYQPDAAAKQLCAESGQAITKAEWAQYIQGLGYKPPCG
ncbi:MAG: helix-turn-helix domain-containing protein [Actinomycetota bacterium]|nr:helix-turn-helix domain-containing protein [Actinomycetota bacterium]